MEKFKWCPLIDAQVEYEERAIIVQFGDGYEQRRKDGLNAMRRTFTNFKFVDDVDDILEFYKRHGSTKKFELDIKGHNAVVCFYDAVTVVEKGNGVRELTCSMREVFS